MKKYVKEILKVWSQILINASNTSFLRKQWLILTGIVKYIFLNINCHVTWNFISWYQQWFYWQLFKEVLFLTACPVITQPFTGKGDYNFLWWLTFIFCSMMKIMNCFHERFMSKYMLWKQKCFLFRSRLNSSQKTLKTLETFQSETFHNMLFD